MNTLVQVTDNCKYPVCDIYVTVLYTWNFIEGMEKVGWGDVPVLAMETVGADCYNQAIKANKLVTLPAITR